MKNIIQTILLTACAATSLSASDTVMVGEDASLAYPSKTQFFQKNIKPFKQKFFVFVDMFPTPSDYNSYKTLTTNQTANLYYLKATGVSGTAIQTSLSRIVNSGGTYAYTTNDRIINLSYWTDCELKVIDKYGNIVYFTSTIFLNSSQVAQMHPEITDSNPTIYFFGTYGYSTTGCYGQKTKFTNFSSSIGTMIGTSNTITGVWIYPDLSSQETRQVPVWTGYNQSSGTQQVVWGEYVREVFENPENTIIIWRQTTSTGEYYYDQKLWRPVNITYYGEFYYEEN